jgi:SAM-dependent methyltransferase
MSIRSNPDRLGFRMTHAETYGRVHYEDFPLPQTHPSRLFALGKMAGMDPPPIQNCRVLELGASGGVNLIPMAHRLPHAEFVGIDLAQGAIDRGNAFARDLGLTNLTLTAMDILDFGASFGRFDYIIAHGVYAWTPEHVRDKVLAICGEALSPHGIAFISYNTQPVGHIRRMVREMMLFHARDCADPAEQVVKAREMLALLARKRSPQEIDRMDAYDAVLAAHAAELLHKRSGNQTFHDDLEVAYEPVSFADFVDHGRRHGLQYVDDAGALDPRGGAIPKGLDAATMNRVRAMAAGDRIAELQYCDYLRMRRFRQSLICRSAVQLTPEWDPARATGLHASTRVVEVTNEVFASNDDFRMTASHPVPLAYLRRLIGLWPASEIVRAEDSDVAAALFRAGAIALHGAESAARRLGDGPVRADPLIRFQASRGEPMVTTLWHEALETDAEMRQLLGLLDGTLDCAAIARQTNSQVDAIRRTLEDFSAHGMLTA